jgi:hypothetical protein
MCGISAGSVLVCDLPDMLDHQYVAYQLDCLSCRNMCRQPAVFDVVFLIEHSRQENLDTDARSTICASGTLTSAHIVDRASTSIFTQILDRCPAPVYLDRSADARSMELCCCLIWLIMDSEIILPYLVDQCWKGTANVTRQQRLSFPPPCLPKELANPRRKAKMLRYVRTSPFFTLNDTNSQAA